MAGSNDVIAAAKLVAARDASPEAWAKIDEAMGSLMGFYNLVGPQLARAQAIATRDRLPRAIGGAVLDSVMDAYERLRAPPAAPIEGGTK